MEDDGFVDDGFIEETAWEYAGRYGAAGLAQLRRMAHASECAGDTLAAQTWRAVAESAERILKSGRQLGAQYGKEETDFRTPG